MIRHISACFATSAACSIDVGPGEAVCVPRGTIHGFENRGSVDAKFLAIATPGVFGPDYFEEIAEVLGTSAGAVRVRASRAYERLRKSLRPFLSQRG